MLMAALGAWAFAPIPLCVVRLWLHIPCPGCGATRAVLRAAQGDFAGSFHLHPLAIPAALLLVPSLLLIARDVARHDVPQRLPRSLRLAWTVFMVALFAVWIARFAGFLGGPAPI